jgi:hypothetical protein
MEMTQVPELALAGSASAGRIFHEHPWCPVNRTGRAAASRIAKPIPDPVAKSRHVDVGVMDPPVGGKNICGREEHPAV